MTSLRAAIAAFLLFTLTASTGWAQSNVEKAQAHFEKGAELYFVGEYEKAISEFEKANSLTPDPVILYNISLAHQKLGNEDAALAVARLASTMGTFDEVDSVRNEARILGLRDVMEARRVADDLNRASDERSVAESEAPTQPEVVASDGTEPPTARWSPWRWTAVWLAGGGALMLTTAGVYELQVGRLRTDFEEAASAGDREDFEALRERIGRSQTAGKIFLYGGLAFAAGGVTVWVLDDQGMLGGTEAAVFVGPTKMGLRVRY